jgi:hypothetical protein
MNLSTGLPARAESDRVALAGQGAPAAERKGWGEKASPHLKEPTESADLCRRSLPSKADKIAAMAPHFGGAFPPEMQCTGSIERDVRAASL